MCPDQQAECRFVKARGDSINLQTAEKIKVIAVPNCITQYVRAAAIVLCAEIANGTTATSVGAPMSALERQPATGSSSNGAIHQRISSKLRYERNGKVKYRGMVGNTKRHARRRVHLGKLSRGLRSLMQSTSNFVQEIS